jgi:hypothetical protein
LSSRPLSSPEYPGQLKMVGPDELIDRRHSLEAVAAADQPGGVAGEGGRVTRDCDNRRYRRGGECFRLPGGAGARGIEHRSGVTGERAGRNRIAGQIAPLDGKSRLVCGGSGECSSSARIALDGVDRADAS